MAVIFSVWFQSWQLPKTPFCNWGAGSDGAKLDATSTIEAVALAWPAQTLGNSLTSTDTGQRLNQLRHWAAAWPAQTLGSGLTSTDTGQQLDQHRQWAAAWPAQWAAAWPAQTVGSGLTSTDSGQQLDQHRQWAAAWPAQAVGIGLTSTDTGHRLDQHRQWAAAWPAQTLGSGLTSTDTGQRPAYQDVVRVEAADCPVVIPHSFLSCLMPSSPISHTTGWVVPFGLRGDATESEWWHVMSGLRGFDKESEWCHVWSQWPWQGQQVVPGLGGCDKESEWWFNLLEIIDQGTKQCNRPESGSDSWHALRVWWNARPEIESDWWHVLRVWWNARPEIESTRCSGSVLPSVEQASEEKLRMTCVLPWKYQKHRDDARHTATEVDTELQCRQCRKRKRWSRVFNVASRGTGHVSDDLVTSCCQQSHYDQLNHNYQLKHFLNIFSDMCLGQFQGYDSCIPSTSMNCVTDYGSTLTDPICLVSPVWMT